MDNFKPSYETYKKIISDIKETGKYCDYSNAIDKDEFIQLILCRLLIIFIMLFL